MDVLNFLLTTNQILQNSSKIFQKSLGMSPKILKSQPKIKFSMSAAGLLGPYLVSTITDKEQSAVWKFGAGKACRF